MRVEGCRVEGAGCRVHGQRVQERRGAHTLTHSHTHTLTHSHTHTLTHSRTGISLRADRRAANQRRRDTNTLTHSHTHTLPHSHTTTLTHSHTHRRGVHLTMQLAWSSSSWWGHERGVPRRPLCTLLTPSHATREYPPHRCGGGVELCRWPPYLPCRGTPVVAGNLPTTAEQI